MSPYSKIVGVGVYLPQGYSNNELINITGIDSSDNWIFQRTGIKKRTIGSKEESNVTMAIKASKIAIKEANTKLGITKPELIIAATNTNCAAPNSGAGWPCAAGKIQAALDDLVEQNCGTFDVQAGCTGINYALAICDGFIRSGLYKTILVIGADKLSDVVDFRQRETCVILGDGALAYMLIASPEKGFVGHRLFGDGTKGDYIVSPLEERLPFGEEKTVLGPTIHMQGRRVYKFAVPIIANALINFQDDTKLNPEGLTFHDLKGINPHQSNRRILEHASDAVAKELTKKGTPVSQEQVLKKIEITIDKHGNNSTASPGLGFKNLRQSLKPGDHVLMIGAGSGFTWATNLYRF